VQTSWRFRETGFALLLVLAATLSWLPRTRGPIDFRWDSAVYYTLGTSIYERHSYRLLNEPGEIRATVFPPLLPLVVAGHQAVLRTSDPLVVGRWLRGTFWALLSGYFVAAYVLLRARLPPGLAAAGVLLCVLQWFPHWLSDRCYSDLPFATGAVLFSVLMRSPRTAGSTSGAIAVASYFLRSTGLALLAAWVGERVVARDWRAAAVRGAIAVVPVLGWQGYVTSVEHTSEYRAPAYPYQRAPYNVYNVSYSRLASFRDHRHPHRGFVTTRERIVRFFTNAAHLPVAMGGAVSARQEQWESLMERVKAMPRVGRVVPWRTIPLLLGTLGLLICIGLVTEVTEGKPVIALALAANAVLVCLMPVSYLYELPRYLVVFAPPLTLALMDGVRTVWRAWRGPAAAAVFGALLTVVLSVQIVVLAALFSADSREAIYTDFRGHRIGYRLFTYDDIALGQDRAIEWLNSHAQPGQVVVSSSPHWVYLRTGLHAVMPPMIDDPSAVQRLLDSVPASYVLVEGPGSLGGEYVAPAMTDRPDQWELVVSEPSHHFEMYARRSR
jgi:hypothetical protein